MRRLIIIASASVAAAGVVLAAVPRPTFDRVGVSTLPEQIEKVIALSREAEKEELHRTLERAAKIKAIAAIGPHEDHMYAGRVYVHAVPPVARADTIVVFAVIHRKARELLKDPKDVLVFEDFESWEGPYGPVSVDAALRDHLRQAIPADRQLLSSEAHSVEHSVEALVPFVQSENRSARIVPILVTEMSFERMNKVAEALSKALASYLEKNALVLGDDVAILISSDAVHYGPDFEYGPFGLDAAAHEKARDQDIDIGKTYLTKTITKTKIEQFTARVWGEKIPWCGRFSIPLGLLAAQKTVKLATGGKLEGVPLRYSDSYTLGVLPIFGAGIGTTAPFSLEHWVGYWALVYGTPAG